MEGGSGRVGSLATSSELIFSHSEHSLNQLGIYISNWSRWGGWAPRAASAPPKLRNCVWLVYFSNFRSMEFSISSFVHSNAFCMFEMCALEKCLAKRGIKVYLCFLQTKYLFYCSCSGFRNGNLSSKRPKTWLSFWSQPEIMWERRIFYKKYSSFRSIQQQSKDVNFSSKSRWCGSCFFCRPS